MTTSLEERAKYSQDEIDELGAKGEAFKNDDGTYSYPVADEEDLKNAIRAVGRSGSDHDAVRKFIIKRAKALGASDLIPDNWNSDGSLTDAEEKSHLWTAEQRDTANDVFAALSGIIGDAYDNTWSVWVQDWYGDGADTPYTVVYYCHGDIMAATFTIDGDGIYHVSIDAARKVRPCTTYVDRSNPKRESRALPKSAEWRKKKALELRGAERRVRLEHVEVRDNPDGTKHLTGYASVTDTGYDMGWYTEQIARGAFKKTLTEDPDVQLLINHAGLPLARTKSGTLQLSEDNIGLRVDADLDPEDPDVQSLTRKMDRGDVDQMSFAFRATRQSWTDDYTERTITEVDLHRGDVSVVNQGANPYTSSSVRADDALASLRHAGPLGVLEAMLDLRRYAGTTREKRVGMTLSASTQEVLSQILTLCAVADDAMDQAQPILAELMGVPNPDEPDDEPPPDDEPEDTGDAGIARSDDLAREMRARLEKHRFPRRNVA